MLVPVCRCRHHHRCADASGRLCWIGIALCFACRRRWTRTFTNTNTNRHSPRLAFAALDLPPARGRTGRSGGSFGVDASGNGGGVEPERGATVAASVTSDQQKDKAESPVLCLRQSEYAALVVGLATAEQCSRILCQIVVLHVSVSRSTSPRPPHVKRSENFVVGFDGSHFSTVRNHYGGTNPMISFSSRKFRLLQNEYATRNHMLLLPP